MGQKQKARQVAQEHEFAFQTTANAGEIMDVLKAAAQAAGPGGLKGSYKLASAEGPKNGHQFTSEWEFYGPGGLVKVMTFTITGEELNGGTAVDMEIGDFKYQKGPLFFMKPTLNGGKQLKKFGQIAMQQLNGQPA